MLISPEQLESAVQYVTRATGVALTGRKYKLKGPAMLPVNTRGVTVLTRDEAFMGDEEFFVHGAFTKSTGYNEYKSVMIFKPAWPTDFSNIHLTFEQAETLLEKFSGDLLGVTVISADAKMEKAQRVIKAAKDFGVSSASQETMKDDRFGSW